MILSIDFETRSSVDLRKTGVYPYAAHASTDVWCMAWAFDDDEPAIWTPQDCGCAWVRSGGLVYHDTHCGTHAIFEHVRNGGEVRAWNAQFERVIWNLILRTRYGFPPLTRAQTFDTAADAAALALPRGLETAAKALGLDVQKDTEGHKLMMKLAKPAKPTKKLSDPWRFATPEALQRLYEYCKQDVRTERAIAQRIRPLSEQQRAVYLLDQTINDRGVRIDVPLVTAAQVLVDEATRRANEEVKRITAGEVETITQRGKLLEWLQYRDPEIEDLRKDTVRDLLTEEDRLDPVVREALQLRADAAKSSTAKLGAMLHAVGNGERARGLLLYHGASTGRWSGKLIQPQNLARPTIGCAATCASKQEVPEGAKKARCDCGGIERFIDRVLALDYEGIEAEAPVLAVISSLLRSMLIASPRRRLIAGDYAQIEARVVAWLAGQDDLVELFATGAKVYEVMASLIYGVPVEEIGKEDPRRQIGKNTILGAGFGMWVDTFIEQVRVQTGIVLSFEEALLALTAYRERYSRIPRLWYDVEDAAKNAVNDPGATYTCGAKSNIRFTVRSGFLFCRLPSGRLLAYALPAIKERTIKRKKTLEDGSVVEEEFTRRSLSYMAVNSMTKKWWREFTYGGKLVENIVQAVAYDLIAAAGLRVEAAGYPVVLTVHDELVSDVPNGHGSVEDFLRLMRVLPRWAEGLPVAAEGWEGARYRK